MDFQRQILKGLMNPYVPSSQRRFTDDEVIFLYNLKLFLFYYLY